jgi:6-phosphogluconolactonase (cycloisomerase 2 family)
MPRRIWLAALVALLGFLNVAVSKAQTQRQAGRIVLYAAVGAELTWYDIDADKGVMNRRGSIQAPANVQEAWKHPSKDFLYVAWSNGGSSYTGGGGTGPVGDKHGVSAYRIDRATGALTAHGEPGVLPSRPVYITTDVDGTHVIAGHNEPSRLTVLRILPDGAVGEEVPQAAKLDFGIYGHQVRIDPSNRAAILVTRGNGPTADKPEDPGAIRIFSYRNGVLSPRQTVAPNGGFNFQVRHIEFHPSGKWVYANLERQNKVDVFRRSGDGILSEAPIFMKDPAADPGKARGSTSSIHAHPNGRFLYVADRVSGGGEIAVFSINQETGEPTLIQSAPTRGLSPRTFALDESGRVLVAANQSPGPLRDGTRVPARLTLFHIGSDGKLEFASLQDLETTTSSVLFWAGIVSLP